MTREEEDSLNLLQQAGDKLCELVNISKKLPIIMEMINSEPALCYYIDLNIAKTKRDEFQKGYDKQIMIFKLLIKTESELLG